MQGGARRAKSAATTRGIHIGKPGVFVLCLALFVSGLTWRKAANAAPSSAAIGCETLRTALEARQISAELYNTYCTRPVENTGAVAAIPSAEETIQVIRSGAPSMLASVQKYGPPERLLALLLNTAIGGPKNLATDLSWDLYPGLVDYVTSKNPDYYLEERLPSSGAPENRGGAVRYTTPFWIAMRANSGSLISKILSAAPAAPYRLEHDPAFQGFPCAAHPYLCVMRSQQGTEDRRDKVFAALEAFGVQAPSWTAPAGLQELSRLRVRLRGVSNADLCAAGGAGDCGAILRLIGQSGVPANDDRTSFRFSDYAGYDVQGRRHLVTGLSGDTIVAAWIASPVPGNGVSGASDIELVSLKISRGRIIPHKYQIGKRIEYGGTLRQLGKLVFDAPGARYEIRISEQNYN